MNHPFFASATALGTALILAGCGTSADPGAAGSVVSPNLAFAEDAAPTLTTISVPAFDLDSRTQELADFEADWVCEVQHRTFGSTKEISVALEERLAEHDISEEIYGEFRSSISEDETIRAAILSMYQTTCSR